LTPKGFSLIDSFLEEAVVLEFEEEPSQLFSTMYFQQPFLFKFQRDKELKKQKQKKKKKISSARRYHQTFLVLLPCWPLCRHVSFVFDSSS